MWPFRADFYGAFSHTETNQSSGVILDHWMLCTMLKASTSTSREIHVLTLIHAYVCICLPFHPHRTKVVGFFFLLSHRTCTCNAQELVFPRCMDAKSIISSPSNGPPLSSADQRLLLFFCLKCPPSRDLRVMHVVMYSIQSSFCTGCPLPSSSDTALICTGDFVQPLASLLCLGGVEVSGPERARKTKSRLCWHSVRMGDSHCFVEAVQERAARRLASFLTVCMPLAEMYVRRAVSAMASWWNHGVALNSCFASLVALWLCQGNAPRTWEKVLNQLTAAARRPPNDGSGASWKLWLDWDFCLSAFFPFHLQQGHCGPPADVRSVFIWMSIDLGAMPREGSL